MNTNKQTPLFSGLGCPCLAFSNLGRRIKGFFVCEKEEQKTPKKWAYSDEEIRQRFDAIREEIRKA